MLQKLHWGYDMPLTQPYNRIKTIYMINPRIVATQFKALLRAERETRALTLQEASALMKLRNPQTLSAYENGLRVPSIVQANKLLKIYGLSIKFG